jgi:uncharacterized protein (TIGR02271 family)
MDLRRESNVQHGTGYGSVAGLFPNYMKAEKAILELKNAGFPENQIGLARSDYGERSTEPTYQEDRSVWDKIRSAFGGEPSNEQDYAYHDDFYGSLQKSGMPEDKARYFGQRMQKGGWLVMVNTSGGRASEAITILERNGADIGSAAADFGKEQPATKRTEAGGEHRIELLGELLRVHKERVARGEVRLRKDVVSETKKVEVPVTREELVVERMGVEGERRPGGQIGSEKEIRVPLSEEKVRVEKEPVVTGEVRVGKRQVQETKQVADTVRREDVKVDKEGDVELDEQKLKDEKKKRIA